MTNKKFLMMWICLTAIILLAACSNNDPPNNTNQVNDNPVNENDGNDPIDLTEYEKRDTTLTVYGHMYNGDWERTYEPFLTERFPNYEFVFISAYDETAGLSVEELITTGTKIDLFQGAAGALQERFMPVGLHYPMNDLMEKHGIDPDDFIPQFLTAGMDGDDHLALPISNNNFVMFYNKSIFDRFGVNHPWDGMTWDEAIALSEEITRHDDKQYIGLWYSPKHYLRVNQKSLGFVDPDTNEPIIDSDGWTDMVTTLFQRPMTDPGLQSRASEKFFGHDDFRNDEVVGMYVYSAGWMNDNAYVDWDAVSIPTFDGDGIGTQPLANYWGLASTSEHKDEAMRVLKYLMGEEYQGHWSREGRMGSLQSDNVQSVLYENVENVKDKNLENAIFTNTYAEQRKITPLDEIVLEGPLAQEILPEIVRGNVDVNQGLRMAKDSAKQKIEQELLRQQVGN